MEQPLLLTKFFIPLARSTLVSRPRLIEQIAQAHHAPLTLISAPAGAGKTTLLREWIDAYHPSITWLSLDEGDNDPTRFWSQVIAALQTGWDNFFESGLTLLRTPQPVPIESLLVLLINEIAAAPNNLVLVLDDYHVIKTPSIHEALAFLLDHLSPQLRLIISSRVDPLLPLGRMRARGQLTELRDADLRFTPEEAATFLNQVMGLNLSTTDVAALEARTEGWIAGLQLAALSLQRHDPANRTQFIADFTGDDRYILDYLVGEILGRQTEHIQTFLLETAILNRLSGSLCNMVTGGKDGQAMLEMLEQANLFLIPLDNRREWYRYHHLFADLLRHQLERTYPGRAFELHQRAATWYEQQGFYDAAIEHTLAAHDYENAARLLRIHASSMLLVHGEPHTLVRWLTTVPETIFDAYPAFRLARSWAFLGTSQLESVEQQLAAIKKRADFHENSNQPLWGDVALLHGTVAVLRGDLKSIFEQAQQATLWVPEYDTIGRSFAAWLLGQSRRFSGKASEAERAFLQAAELARTAGSHFVELMASGNRADRLIEQGKLSAGFNAHRALQSGEINRGRHPLFIVGDSLIWSGGVLREWNDLDNAARDIELGIEIVQGMLREAIVLGYIALSRVRLAQHDENKALDAIDKALASARSYGVPYLLMRAEAWQAQIWLAQGLWSLAFEWAHTSGLHADDPVTYRDEELYLGLARIWIAQGRQVHDNSVLQQASEVLERVCRAATEGGRTGRLIEVSVLQALLFDAQSKGRDALSLLAQILALAESEGYTRIFLDEGAPMALLLAQLAQKGMGNAYVERLLSAFAVSSNTPSSREAPIGVVDTHDFARLRESLSERELEVLRLIGCNQTNQEIAEALYVSVNTIKTHIKRIYEKLDVSNRFEAVELARQFKLL